MASRGSCSRSRSRQERSSPSTSPATRTKSAGSTSHRWRNDQADDRWLVGRLKRRWPQPAARSVGGGSLHPFADGLGFGVAELFVQRERLPPAPPCRVVVTGGVVDVA